jgi:hypothetical protein
LPQNVATDHPAKGISCKVVSIFVIYVRTKFYVAYVNTVIVDLNPSGIKPSKHLSTCYVVISNLIKEAWNVTFNIFHSSITAQDFMVLN